MAKPKVEVKVGVDLNATLALINKKFGKGSLIAMSKKLDHDEGVIPTGSRRLNKCLGIGGWPCGRVVELYGPPASGKCLPKDTYLTTGEGVVTIEELFASKGYKASNTTRTTPAVVSLLNRYGEAESTSTFTWNYTKSVTRITLSDGTEVRSTANHPHLVLQDMWHGWRKTKDISVGDYFVRQDAPVPSFGPGTLNKDVAYLWGVLVADAHFGSKRVSVTNDDEKVLRILREVGPTVFGVAPREYSVGGSMDIHFNTKEGVQAFYNRSGFSEGVARDKRFSLQVRSLDKGSVANVIRGYMDCESYFDGTSIEVTSASKELLRQLKLLLLGFGVHACLKPKVASNYPDNEYWRLFISGIDLDRYAAEIDCSYEREGGSPSRTSWQVPTIQEAMRVLSSTALGHGNDAVHAFVAGHTHDARGALNALDELQGADEGLVCAIRKMCAYRYPEVVSIDRDVESVPTFDVVMPRTHSFLAEGIVTHNTTLSLHAIASAQKMGKRVAFIDAEHALDLGWARKCGVDDDDLLVSQPDYGEQALEICDMLVQSNQVGLIVVDSVAALTPKAELEGDIGDHHVGLQARMMSQAMRKIVASTRKHNVTVIFINQTRMKIGVKFGSPITTTGGEALKFYASIRAQVNRIGQHMDGDVAVSSKVKVKVVKNRMSPPFRECEFVINFHCGIYAAQEILEDAVEAKPEIVHKGGTWLSYTDDSGTKHKWQGRNKALAALNEAPELLAELEGKISPDAEFASIGAADTEADVEEGATKESKKVKKVKKEAPDESAEDAVAALLEG